MRGAAPRRRVRIMVSRSFTPPIPMQVVSSDIPEHMTVREYRRATHPRQVSRRRLRMPALFRRRDAVTTIPV
jgi:hypothetical protein